MANKFKIPFLNKKEESEEKQTFSNAFESLYALAETKRATSIMEHMNRIKGHSENCYFESEEAYLEFVETVLNNPVLITKDFKTLYEEGEGIYRSLKEHKKLFKHFYQTKGLYENGAVLKECLSLFEDPTNYMAIMEALLYKGYPFKDRKTLIELFTNIAIYTVGDNDYCAALLYFANHAEMKGDYQKTADEIIGIAKKKIGLYDELDEKTLAKWQTIIKEAAKPIVDLEKSRKEIASLMQDLASYKTEAQIVDKTINEKLNQFEDYVDHSILKHQEEMKAAYVELVAKLRNVSFTLEGELSRSAERKALDIANRTLEKMQNEAHELSSVSTNVKSSMQDLEKLKAELETKLEEGLKSIEKSLLGSENVDFSKIKELISTNSNEGKTTEKIILPSAPITFQGEIFAKEETEVPKVLPCFDPTIPFKERYQQLMKIKKKQQEKGIIYNERLEDCLYAILANRTIYLYGPTGAGKSTLIKQLEDFFPVPFIPVDYIDDKFEVSGGNTANGGYSRSKIYDCYRLGYIAYYDEIDNGSAKSTIKLHPFMDGLRDSYSFPVVGKVNRHPNFRVIVAGNTSGMGATSAYNTRAKLDEGTIRRVEYIPIDYDTKYEEFILKEYPEWFAFVMLYRKAVKNYWIEQDDQIRGQISTAHVSHLAFDLSQNIRSEEKILERMFVEPKSDDYLNFITKYMENHNDEKAKKLVKEFASLVEKRS